MNPVDNANMIDSRHHSSTMRNKTPWVWQNFWEGLQDEELPHAPHAKAPARIERNSQRTSSTRLSDECLPASRPLLNVDSLYRHQSKNASAPSCKAANDNNETEPSLTAELPNYVVVQNKNEISTNDSPEESSRKPALTVPNWKLEEREAFHPRWSDLDASFKDLGLQ